MLQITTGDGVLCMQNYSVKFLDDNFIEVIPVGHPVKVQLDGENAMDKFFEKPPFRFTGRLVKGMPENGELIEKHIQPERVEPEPAYVPDPMGSPKAKSFIEDFNVVREAIHVKAFNSNNNFVEAAEYVHKLKGVGKKHTRGGVNFAFKVLERLVEEKGYNVYALQRVQAMSKELKSALASLGMNRGSVGVGVLVDLKKAEEVAPLNLVLKKLAELARKDITQAQFKEWLASYDKTERLKNNNVSENVVKDFIELTGSNPFEKSNENTVAPEWVDDKCQAAQ